MEVTLNDPAVLEADFPKQRRSQSIDNGALDLRLNSVRVDNVTRIDGADHPQQFERPVFIEPDLPDLCTVTAVRGFKCDAPIVAFMLLRLLSNYLMQLIIRNHMFRRIGQ